MQCRFCNTELQPPRRVLCGAEGCKKQYMYEYNRRPEQTKARAAKRREAIRAAIAEAETRRGEFRRIVDERRALVAAKYKSGMTCRAIAAEMGISYQRVHQILRSKRQ